MVSELGLVFAVWAANSSPMPIHTMLRTSQLSPRTQGLALGLLGLAAVAVAAPQQAQAVTVSFTSAQLPELCPIGTCHFDVLPTAPINYTQLNATYPPSYAGYNYNFQNTLLALKFLNAYQTAFLPSPPPAANNGQSGLGEIPSSPGGNNPGGPLFFTNLSSSPVIPGTFLTQANGLYYTTTATSFASFQGGTGFLAGAPGQNQVWAVYKCTSGVCVPTPNPLPILGASAAFGYSRRLRQKIQASQS